jgi:hypothetical protein
MMEVGREAQAQLATGCDSQLKELSCEEKTEGTSTALICREATTSHKPSRGTVGLRLTSGVGLKAPWATPEIYRRGNETGM